MCFSSMLSSLNVNALLLSFLLIFIFIFLLFISFHRHLSFLFWRQSQFVKVQATHTLTYDFLTIYEVAIGDLKVFMFWKDFIIDN